MRQVNALFRSRRAKASASSGEDYNENTLIIAQYLMWYPAAYLFCTLPIAITELMKQSGHLIPLPAITFSSTMYSLTGLAVVIVFVSTHRVFGGKPFRLGIGSVTLQGDAAKRGTESFEAPEKRISPVSPPNWKPSTQEWLPPPDRTPRNSMISTRSRPVSTLSRASSYRSVYSTGTEAHGSTVPPVPPIITENLSVMEKTHRRMRSDSTLVGHPPSQHLRTASGSNNSSTSSLVIGQRIQPDLVGLLHLEQPQSNHLRKKILPCEGQTPLRHSRLRLISLMTKWPHLPQAFPHLHDAETHRHPQTADVIPPQESLQCHDQPVSSLWSRRQSWSN